MSAFAKSTLKSKKKKRKLLPTRKKLVKSLDKVVWEYLKRTQLTCVTCGTEDQPTPGHYVSRREYCLRWDLRNVHTQCWGCNFRHTYDSLPYTQAMIAKYGVGILDELMEVRRTHTKFSTPDLRELLVKLEEELK